MRKLIGVYGSSGCGRRIMPLVRAQHPNATIVFIDDALSSWAGIEHEIMSWSDFKSKRLCKEFDCDADKFKG